MAILPLAGLWVRVDDADVEWIAALDWHKRDATYVAAFIDRGHRSTMLHHILIGHPIRGREVVDHINGDSTDNRRCNLRYASQAQNGWNRVRRNKNNTSGYPGVTYCKNTGLWRAGITPHGKHICLGRFATPEQAFNARMSAEIKYFGEFAPKRTTNAP